MSKEIKEIYDYEVKLAQLKADESSKQDQRIEILERTVKRQQGQINDLIEAIEDKPDNPDVTNPPDITIPDNIAFKGARGAGAYATGGRDKEKYIITNLNDDGEGSFREACRRANERNGLDVTSQISGVINLQTPLDTDVSHSRFDLRGPDGEGLTFGGETLILKGNNCIFRYFRKRGGTKDKDAFTGYYLTNSIFDHISFSWGQDEAASWVTDTNRDLKDVTIQNCLFAESKTGSIVGSLATNLYGYTDRISFLNNLYYNVSHRFPNVYGNGRFDVVGNVAWNMKKRLIRANGNIKLNQYGNYYDYGTPIHDRILNHYSFEEGHTPLIYSNFNKIVSTRGVREGSGYNLDYSIDEMNMDNSKSWKWFIDNAANGTDRGDQLPEEFFTDAAFEWLGVEPMLLFPDAAFNYALDNAGCNLVRDSWDTEWINEIKNGNRTQYMKEPYPTI